MNAPSARRAHTPAAPESSDPSASVILFVIGFMAMQPIATDVYLASLPAIGEAFAVGASGAQLTLSMFFAGFALSQLIVGPLADRFGRRPIAIAGCTLYVGASLAGAFAPSLAVLLAARLVQAIGTCCVVICARAIVRDCHGPEQAAQVMSRALAWMALAPITGPLLGGLLEETFGWRANLIAIAAAGAVMLWFALRNLAETNRHRNPQATAPRELASTYALIIRSRTFLTYTFFATGTFCALYSFISGSPFVAIRVLGIAPREFGLLFGGVVIGFIVGAALGRRGLPRWGIAGTIRRGAILQASGGVTLLTLALLDVQTVWSLMGPMFIILLGHGLVQPSSQMGAIGPFPRQAGAAAALAGFLMYTVAVPLGLALGAGFNDTMLPLAVAVATSTCATLAGALLLPAMQRETPSS
ncbi:MAG: multidrug effflux MFS transporter [Betaproteobacteria bacterium]|nr:multidrug effflux MFS transporter [Betaproteobacteria bacterium]